MLTPYTHSSSQPLCVVIMECSQVTIPLFPLNVVLFPNGLLPLNIFEDRYLLMIQRCLDNNLDFGIALIKSGVEVGGPAEPHLVGTTARIIDSQTTDDGRINIAVTGRDRFLVDKITQESPYIEGTVSFLEEDRTETLNEADLTEIHRATAEQIRLLHGLRGGWVREPEIPADPSALSWLICSLIQADNNKKQALLEESSTTLRLRSLLPILDKNAVVMKKRIARRFSQ